MNAVGQGGADREGVPEVSGTEGRIGRYYTLPGRRPTRTVMCGGIPVGGGAPVSIQSMTNTDTRDVKATASQVAALAAAGCDIVRCAVPDESAAVALKGIRAELAARGVRVPLVADIHFDHRLAIAAIENGADKIRINPGNIGGDDRLRAVVERARAAGVPIRVGVNGGSIEKDIAAEYGGPTAEALAESALRNIDRVASGGFEDIVVSVKSSDVRVCGETLHLLSERTDFPLHLGVTEAGVGDRALVKSAVGIGALLEDGIGDTIRVSLTGDPLREIYSARDILASVGLLPGAIDVISCPTCGRCKIDLPRIAEAVWEAVSEIETERVVAERRESFAECAELYRRDKAREYRPGQESFTVAVMGCAVNGPGEASRADIGVACGNGVAVLFKEGVKIATFADSDIVPRLIAEVSDTLGSPGGSIASS
ncbi:MAG: flavodoxin-dependent (E)-4-hydroxy-3-methylbut-2-enyl-diphosphate synthase [Clostridiales Family XIII bacterium]|jgi:(E)-4-hydroxy-3-methylbut-2-enyl-diphosphate synthase|nr:flavodoxin-dependent (E)-4-hydroxy-3-methylbut-2-enyl-diphosphate synthase [Clostridiales Family XIII bacterium]